MRVLAAPDKFRGTASAREIAAAIAAGAADAGATCRQLPLADGGEGLLDVLPGQVRVTRVRGPLGAPVDARWLLDAEPDAEPGAEPGAGGGATAVVEAAQACGLVLAGGAQGNDPLAASSRGVGELVAAAVAAGAARVLVGVGGSASTDGGRAAVDVLAGLAPFGDPRRGGCPTDLVVACDVATAFLDAADVFAPQKGASPEQVLVLRRRLADVAAGYRRRFGVDVTVLAGGGAAGGLAGGLAALGATLVPGFGYLADRLDLQRALAEVDLVVTGEGRFDRTSALGKVVAGVAARAREAGVPCLVVAGDAEPGVPAPGGAELAVLARLVGPRAARSDPAAAVRRVVAGYLAGARGGAAAGAGRPGE